jgi:hypothetical protein
VRIVHEARSKHGGCHLLDRDWGALAANDARRFCAVTNILPPHPATRCIALDWGNGSRT